MKVLSAFLSVAAFSGACFAQTISSVSPSAADAGQVLPVTITGGGFTQCVTSGKYPYCYTILQTPSLVSGASSLPAVSFNVPTATITNATFNIPDSAATGFWNLIAGSVQLTNAVLISAASDSLIDSISPIGSNAGLRVAITIYATHAHFRYVQTDSAINNIGIIELLRGTASIQADSFSITSSTVCKAYFTLPISASVGLWDLLVTQTIGRPSVILAKGFSIASTAVHSTIQSRPALSVKTTPIIGGFVVEIVMPNPEPEAIQVRLYNVKGSLIRSWNLADRGTTRLRVERAGLARGLLMLQVNAGGRAIRVPVVVE
jgi:hypothetical protein